MRRDASCWGVREGLYSKWTGERTACPTTTKQQHARFGEPGEPDAPAVARSMTLDMANHSPHPYTNTEA